jgi:antitoxin (DNA-binding transcriptional repressor) of toxin-antitoxin stability system
MSKISISSIKANLSGILAKMKPGEVITLCNRNVPVAELRYFGAPHKQRRPLGKFDGKITLSEDFEAPLPAEVVAAFSLEEREI